MSIAIRLACLFFISALVTECYSFDSDKVNNITAGDGKEDPVTGGTPFPTPTIPTTASTTKHPTTTVTTEHHTTTQHKTTHHTTEQSTKHTTEHNLTTHLPPTSHQHNITTAGHTTHAPTPSPSHKWALNDSGVVCILFQAVITLTFEFPNKTERREYVPIDAVPTGNCNRSLHHNDEEYITLTFFKDWKMTFIFTDKNSSYNLSQLNVSFDYSQWKYEKNESFPIFKLEHLEGNKNGQYYKCEEELTIYNGTHSNDTDEPHLIAIQLSNLQMEAFRDEKNEAFNTTGGKTCKSEGKNNSNLIPIIVGSILGGLILIVLIAYLISRRRRRTGYESV